METPSENDQATEDQDATPTPEDATEGTDDATISDAIDDARPDDPPLVDQDGNEIAGDAEVPTAEVEAAPADVAGLPRYKCHKTVQAFKIASMEALTNGDILLTGIDTAHSRIVDAAYVDKHHPKIGGYYVAYHDGYKSWSPARAFEDGYTLDTE